MTSDLKALSTEELQAELARRNQPQSPLLPYPQPLKFQNFQPLEEMCKQYIADVDMQDVDDDWPHYIFEAAIEAVYGRQVWGWVNDKLR